MGMEPVDMSVIDRIGDDTAARSEQGWRNIEEFERRAFSAPESRTASFGQGAAAGREAPAITAGSTY